LGEGGGYGGGHVDGDPQAGVRRGPRRREGYSSCRLLIEMLENLVDLRTFGALGIPTSGEELPESI